MWTSAKPNHKQVSTSSWKTDGKGGIKSISDANTKTIKNISDNKDRHITCIYVPKYFLWMREALNKNNYNSIIDAY